VPDDRSASPTSSPPVRVVYRHLPPTPMWSYPALDAAAGATVFVKHENVQP
jgi:threonine dehydratase